MIPGSLVAGALLLTAALSLVCGFALGYIARQQEDEQ